jgi:hypothetical protein
MIIRQDVLDAAQASLTAWGYHHPQLVHDLYSARLLPGAAYSSHWYLQFRVKKGLDALSPPVFVRLIVREVSGRLFSRDHEESNTPFTGPLLTPRQA